MVGTVSTASKVITRPPFSSWSQLVGSCREGEAALDRTRRELLDSAQRYSESIGIDTGLVPADVPVVLCGHQAEMQHPGITVKSLAASLVAARVGGVAVNVVVDTDEAGGFAACVPAWGSGPGVADIPLFDTPSNVMSGWATPPDGDSLDAWLASIHRSVATAGFPAESLCRFAGIARDALVAGDSLASWATRIRRRFEAPIEGGAIVLELPVSHILATKAWESFVAATLVDAHRFNVSYNRALADFRMRHKTRSAAQPFPDLAVDDSGRWEAPFWLIDDEGTRRAATVDELRTVPARLIAPKAVTLTLFLRSHLADLSIQGLGGERYDEVTDDVATLLGGVSLAPRVLATADVLLPWKVDGSTLRERSAVVMDLDRVRHHPEQWLDHPALDPGRAADSRALVEEKRLLVARIAEAGDEKRSIGICIKAINTELSAVLEPVTASLERELAGIETAEVHRRAVETRSFSYPMFEPAELSAFLESSLADSV